MITKNDKGKTMILHQGLMLGQKMFYLPVIVISRQRSNNPSGRKKYFFYG